MAETEVLEQEQVETQAEETQEQQEEQGNNEFLDVLYNDLGVDIEPPPVEEPEAEPEQQPEPEPDKPEESEPEPEPEKAEEAKPERPKKKFNIKEPELSKDDIKQTIQEEIARHRTKPTLPDQPEPQPEPELEDDLEDFLPEQREEIELAQYAEKVSKKYKGMSDKLKKFYSDLDEYVDKNEDPDRTFDEHDDEFIKWVQKNKPVIPKHEQRKLERQMIKDQALNEAKSEFESKQQDLEDKIRKVEDRPKADKEYTTYEELLNSEKPEDDSLAESIYDEEMKSAKRVGKEYLDLFYGLKTFDQQDPLHTWIVDFVTQQSEAFQKHGGEHLFKTGDDGIKKAFVPPSEYGNVDGGKHWTFTSSDVVEILGNYFSTRAKDNVKHEEERLQKMGFTRQTKNKSQTKAKNEEPKPTKTPKATNSPSPGAAPNSDGVQEEQSPGADILDRLGINM